MAFRKVLLVGWDAADWKVIRPLLDEGKMPNVRRLVEGGAIGRISTLHPPLSPMLWTSIATGKRPFKHGIHGFSEPTPDGRGVQPVTNLSRKSKALWNILNQNGLRSVVIGWWPSHPAEPIDGVMVSDHYSRAGGPLDEGWPLPANTVHPPELAATLAGLRIHPDLLMPHDVEPFIPLAKEIDQDKDKRLSIFLRTLAECMSMQAAAAWLLDNREWDFFAVYFEAIDHFCHAFMRYHPPRQSWIAERDFQLYRNVVSMAYQFHDEMLGALLKKAGDGVTAILLSDHGFHPDHLRTASIPDIPAGPAIEHRDFGVFVISGPGIRKAERIYAPSVLDVAPTILALYGLPVGEDMDGKVLSQAFLTTPQASFIPSWEDVAGVDGRHPSHTRLDPVAAHEALEQMIALGYIERPDESREIAVTRTIRDLRYNLGEAYQDAGRHAEAREIFTELYQADPDEQRFAVRLFVSCQALGLIDEMRRIAADLDGRRRARFEQAQRDIQSFFPAGPALTEDERRALARWRNLARYQPTVADYLKAQVLTAEKRYQEALDALERVTEAQTVRPGVFLQIADLYLRLSREGEARQVYEKALAIDPDNPHAYVGLCRLAMRRRKFSTAADLALEALERVYQYPVAHFLLGRALAGMKEFERAAEALRAAISFNPNFPEAHARLAALLEIHFGDVESAREHRRMARSMRSRGARPLAGAAAVSGEAQAALPVTPQPVEMPELSKSLVVVTGLPRSGTSMLMQMLAAGGLGIVSDEARDADEDNPRGYLEFEPVKRLLTDSDWLFQAQGKAIKIVAPLLAGLPLGLPCRVILCERALDEVLDSQERMLIRRNQPAAATPERRRMLKEEYIRTLARARALLERRPRTQVLTIQHSAAVSDARVTAKKVNDFLGGAMDVSKMAAVIDPALHRNRSGPVTGPRP
jgi:predicted AlkP superfamily phosphohydrolase/phosphomutase/Tfp pilus assembly protein PilF